MMMFELTRYASAGLEPNVTVSPGRKPVPMMNTIVPAGPRLGMTAMAVGVPGGRVTVSLAARVVADPAGLVNAARYSLPDIAYAAVKLSVVEVAPGMFENVPPPFVDSCHCTVGVGVPDAAAVNVTL